jgi:hypothetical protein
MRGGVSLFGEEHGRGGIAQVQMHGEVMWFGDFLDTLQDSVANWPEHKPLMGTIRPDRFGPKRLCRDRRVDLEAGRDAVLVDPQHHPDPAEVERVPVVLPFAVLVVVPVVIVRPMIMTPMVMAPMTMMVAAAEQPGAGDVDREAEAGDGDGLGNAIGTGSSRRPTASHPISIAIIASTMALVKPARSPNLPVPKVNRASVACRRA